MDRILTFPELCRYLRISEATGYRLEAAGEGPPVALLKSGKRYSQAAVDEWFKAKMNGTGEVLMPAPSTARRGRPRREILMASDALRTRSPR